MMDDFRYKESYGVPVECFSINVPHNAFVMNTLQPCLAFPNLNCEMLHSVRGGCKIGEGGGGTHEREGSIHERGRGV